MGLKKVLKKVRKGIKKIAKPALGVGAALLAAKAFGGKKKFGQAAGFLSSGAAGGPYGPTRFHPSQGNRSKWQNMARNYKDDIMTGGTGMTADKTDRPWYKFWKEGGRVNAKKGGKVTGIAKRGFGRALMKGKK